MPGYAASAERRVPDADARPPEGVPTTKVLVVEDEEDTRESLLTVIHIAFPSVEVIGITDGVAALEFLKDTKVDLILSDHKMPQMSGVKFLTEAQHRYPDVPRILMTAYADLDVAVQAINQAHVTSFFMKPLQVEVVVEAVASALGIQPDSLGPAPAPAPRLRL